VALSQLSRPLKGDKNWRPALSDLRDSGSIEQDADGVIFVNATDAAWQEAKDKQCPMEGDLDVAKQRDGPIGRIPVLFDGKYMRITEVA
jgi:replicative DNA helicase